MFYNLYKEHAGNMLYKMYSKCNYFENICTTYLGYTLFGVHGFL